MRHRPCARPQKDSERRGEEQIEQDADEPQDDRAGERYVQRHPNREHDASTGRHQNREAVGPHLAHRDLELGQRHHEQVLERSVLPIADHRGAGQSDREDADLVDHPHDALEPGGYPVRVEPPADDEVDGLRRDQCGTSEERSDAIGKDGLDVTRANGRLRHGRCVDVHLHRGSAPRAKIVLEVEWNHDDEHEPALVHGVFDLVGADLHGSRETRRIEDVEELPGQGRVVLVDEGDRCVGDLRSGARGLDIDEDGERKDEGTDRDRVTQQAAELLEPQPEDVRERRHCYFSCFRRPTKLAARRIGKQQARTATYRIMRRGLTPLVYAPRLALL